MKILNQLDEGVKEYSSVTKQGNETTIQKRNRLFASQCDGDHQDVKCMYATYILLTLFSYSTLFAKTNFAVLNTKIHSILRARNESHFQLITELDVSNI